ncbi:MAG TPA: Rne/Rng family ribonuclease [Candidatus Megaira endosymbiont of Hartmannula sinica]|nr:Rne/Rng family ribonuclease [Candidatus Megaera endosymbiont of Hartmannula sinica]
MKQGQKLLVQVVKEERGSKGVSFTTYIALSGKYSVFLPNTVNSNGVSRKVSGSLERKRLRKIVDFIAHTTKNNNTSLITRTASRGKDILEIIKDYNYLVSLWNDIVEAALSTSSLSFIHQEDDILRKVIRDMFEKDVSGIVIQGNEAFLEVSKVAKKIIPDTVTNIKEYKYKEPIFTKYKIEEKILQLYEPTVSLPSGGYIVINPTEALVSIDINSGKSTSEISVEETAFSTNIEAAKTIAKHIILRDLSGLIVIDFIDMSDDEHNKMIEKIFKQSFSNDRAKVKIGSISSFGLLEMSRQRMRPAFLEMHSKECNYCRGKGVVRNDNYNSILILRMIENEMFATRSKFNIINVYANSSTIIHFLNYYKENIISIENKREIKINCHIDNNSNDDSFSIEKIYKADQIVDYNSKTPILNENIIIEDNKASIEHNQNTNVGTEKPKKNIKKPAKDPNKEPKNKTNPKKEVSKNETSVNSSKRSISDNIKKKKKIENKEK